MDSDKNVQINYDSADVLELLKDASITLKIGGRVAVRSTSGSLQNFDSLDLLVYMIANHYNVVEIYVINPIGDQTTYHINGQYFLPELENK